MTGDGVLLAPIAAMALLTFVVARRMYATRVREMKSRRIRPQALAMSRDIAGSLNDTRAADNYRNLFEAPVLFYAAMLTAAALHAPSPWVVALAWLYVALRCAHSAIHCTYNRVMHRFAAFGASMAVLFALWCIVGWRIAQAIT